MYLLRVLALGTRFVRRSNPIPASYSSASLVISLACFVEILCQSTYTKRLSSATWINWPLPLLGINLLRLRGLFGAHPLVIYLGYCLSKRFGVFGFSAVLSISASAAVLMFGGMRRSLWAAGSVSDRFEMILQSLRVWTNHWFLGVGFRAQTILNSNPLTILDHWYPHNFIAEVLLLGGVILMTIVVLYIVSVGLTTSFDLTSAGLEDPMQVPLTFLWLQGFASALVSGHLALIPGLWVGGLLVVLNRFR